MAQDRKLRYDFPQSAFPDAGAPVYEVQVLTLLVIAAPGLRQGLLFAHSGYACA